MGSHQCMREGDEPHHIRVFPKQNLILRYYMLRIWWINLLQGMVYYAILTGAIEKVLLMNTNHINLAYTYDSRRIKNPTDIVFTLTHFGRLTAWTPSGLD